MSANLPYVPSPGAVKSALEKIKSAATPDRVTQDFVQTKLQIKGGTGTSIPPFLKKIGFINSDGTPSPIYKRFRNLQSSGQAVADAIRIGYRELFDVNEYCYLLSDAELHSLVCQVTGAAVDSSSAKLTVSCFKNLKSFADFDSKESQGDIVETVPIQGAKAIPDPSNHDRQVGLNLAYTINLNLPATSDQAVFNAIFRSLKEHLLDGQ